MRVYNGTIFALDKHFNRLFRGLKLLNVRSPYSRKQWSRRLYQTIKANSLKEARIRLAVWREKGHLRIAIVCQNIKSEGAGKVQTGVKALISSVRRKKTKHSHIKSMDYACFREAFLEAKKEGFDEAILLNSRKEIVEGSRTNIFYFKKEVLYTPMVRCGCLNGITRQIVLQCARQLKIPCKPAVVSVAKLMRADEAFVTNSLVGVVALTAVGQQMICHGKVGPLTKKIINAYNTNVHSSCPA
jgi:branched-chain amino acid aminotransferase